jgi:hypothetical protein
MVYVDGVPATMVIRAASLTECRADAILLTKRTWIRGGQQFHRSQLETSHVFPSQRYEDIPLNQQRL